MGDKSIHDFSAPSTANVAKGPNVINGDANFELKPALIWFKLVYSFPKEHLVFTPTLRQLYIIFLASFP